MHVRETLVIHSRLSWRQVRGVAAIERQHGLQALGIEQLAARLAGGFLQPINSDSLKQAIGEGDPARLHQGDGRLREVGPCDRHAVEEPHPHVRPARQSAGPQSLRHHRVLAQTGRRRAPRHAGARVI
jgi:hypothetical protein